MAFFNVITSQTVDQFLLNNPTYQNEPWTRDTIYISEAAILSQTNAEIEDTLNVVDVILGENSTGTAIIKTGTLSLTKIPFTLNLTYSSAPVTVDSLAPQAPALTTATAYQDITEVEGRTSVTVNWNIPTLNERVNDLLGQATGGTQDMSISFPPISPTTDTVWEVTGYNPFGGNTVLIRDFADSHNLLKVVDVSNFVIGQIVEINDGGGLKWYYEVLSVGTNEIQLNTRCNFTTGFPIGSTVKTVTVIAKTEGTDYTVDNYMGVYTLLASKFSPGNDVISTYVSVLSDLDHFEVYRVPGNTTVVPTAGHTLVTKDAVISTPGNYLIDDAVLPTAPSVTELTPATLNGQTWTYYVFAVDNEPIENSSYTSSVMVETISTIPQDPMVAVGDEQVYLSWDLLPVLADQNSDGFNVFRNDGATFIPADCIRVNSALIGKAAPFFDDSINNSTNRRPTGDVGYPQNGQIYSYKIETEDTTTDWDSGTKNADVETGPEVWTAIKNA